MSTEAMEGKQTATGSRLGAPRRWRRFLTWLENVDEALNTSYDELQDRRIVALERDVAALKRGAAEISACEGE